MKKNSSSQWLLQQFSLRNKEIKTITKPVALKLKGMRFSQKLNIFQNVASASFTKGSNCEIKKALSRNCRYIIYSLNEKEITVT